MYNYKVIIADDESIIRNNLKTLLLKRVSNIECISLCENGQQVLDILNEKGAEIIISDIRMPLVNGLEIAKYVKEHGLKTKVILVTGYSEFEYAHKAIQYGVDKFILKPINFDEIVSVVNDIKDSFSEQLNRLLIDTTADMNKWTIIRKYLFLYLTGMLPYNKISELEILNPQLFLYKRCALVDLQVTDSVVENPPNAYYENMWIDMCEISNEKINCFCLSESEKNVRLLFFIYVDGEEAAQTIVNSHVEECHHLMRVANGIDFTYTIQYMDSLENSTSFNRKELVDMYIEQLLHSNNRSIMDLLQTLSAALPIESIRDFFTNVLNELSENYHFSAEKIAGKIPTINGLSDMVSFANELNEEFRSLFTTDYMVNRMILYINENYGNPDLNFNFIANKFNFNRSYLSRVFKQQIGKNPSEYISDVRIENAKRLLETNKYTVKRVAEKVGYRDEGYFSKAFKKATGVTPLKYLRLGEE